MRLLIVLFFFGQISNCQNQESMSNSDPVDVIKKYSDVRFKLTENFGTKIYIGNMEFNLSLYGKYQINNFLGAYETLKKIDVSDENIQDAVSKVYWPGRFEIYSKKNPLIILDGAHNVDAASRLKENILRKMTRSVCFMSRVR